MSFENTDSMQDRILENKADASITYTSIMKGSPIQLFYQRLSCFCIVLDNDKAIFSPVEAKRSQQVLPYLAVHPSKTSLKAGSNLLQQGSLTIPQQAVSPLCSILYFANHPFWVVPNPSSLGTFVLIYFVTHNPILFWMAEEYNLYD